MVVCLCMNNDDGTVSLCEMHTEADEQRRCQHGLWHEELGGYECCMDCLVTRKVEPDDQLTKAVAAIAAAVRSLPAMPSQEAFEYLIAGILREHGLGPIGAEPRGCPVPGACQAAALDADLRGHAKALRDVARRAGYGNPPHEHVVACGDCSRIAAYDAWLEDHP